MDPLFGGPSSFAPLGQLSNAPPGAQQQHQQQHRDGASAGQQLLSLFKPTGAPQAAGSSAKDAPAGLGLNAAAGAGGGAAGGGGLTGNGHATLHASGAAPPSLWTPPPPQGPAAPPFSNGGAPWGGFGAPAPPQPQPALQEHHAPAPPPGFAHLGGLFGPPAPQPPQHQHTGLSNGSAPAQPSAPWPHAFPTPPPGDRSPPPPGLFSPPPPQQYTPPPGHASPGPFPPGSSAARLPPPGFPPPGLASPLPAPPPGFGNPLPPHAPPGFFPQQQQQQQQQWNQPPQQQPQQQEQQHGGGRPQPDMLSVLFGRPPHPAVTTPLPQQPPLPTPQQPPHQQQQQQQQPQGPPWGAWHAAGAPPLFPPARASLDQPPPQPPPTALQQPPHQLATLFGAAAPLLPTPPGPQGGGPSGSAFPPLKHDPLFGPSTAPGGGGGGGIPGLGGLAPYLGAPGLRDAAAPPAGAGANGGGAPSLEEALRRMGLSGSGAAQAAAAAGPGPLAAPAPPHADGNGGGALLAMLQAHQQLQQLLQPAAAPLPMHAQQQQQQSAAGEPGRDRPQHAQHEALASQPRNSFGTPPGGGRGHDLMAAHANRHGKGGGQQQQQQQGGRHAAAGGPPSRPWDVAALNAQLDALLATLQPTEEEEALLQRALDGVAALLKQQFPLGKVLLFGSAANGLCVSRTNDIDVCLDLGPAFDNQLEKSEAVAQLGVLLQDASMEQVVALPKARVPVVKFVYPSTGTSVDVTINNMLPLANTRLLATYAALDPRLRQLAMLVKHWAKTRGVNDTYRGTLSSYAYVLLCIGLLQQRSPPVLPNLQRLPGRPLNINGWDCSFCDDVEALKDFGKSNTETIAELLAAFFAYWGTQHDYNNAVLSIRSGGLISKRSKDWTRRHERDRHLVCIEDPFELSHDLGRCVDWQSVRTLRGEFERAARIMATEADPLSKLLRPWQLDRPGAPAPP